MWSYILRRLLIMIPTLFGVTIVSFVIMQIAPGDPLLNQMSSEGNATQQEHEAFLIQKRDLKLDKPLLLNFRGFHDYRGEMLDAAWVRAHTSEQILEALPAMAAGDDPQMKQLAKFLRRVFHDNSATFFWERDEFTPQLDDELKHPLLPAAIRSNVQVWCENIGTYAVPEAMELLASDDASREEKIGLIDCLNLMVVEPHKFTYSSEADPLETEDVVAVWKLWWERDPAGFPELSDTKRQSMQKQLDTLLAAKSRSELFELVEEYRDYSWSLPDMRFFIDRLLGDSSHDEKVISAMILKFYVSVPLRMGLPKDASEAQVNECIENWQLHYDLNKDKYEHGALESLTSVVTDTQYAHMVWRLATFQFGRSALRTREPVGEKLWNGVEVSAPLMLMSSLLIYAIAIPLGIICSATHGGFVDRAIAIALFFLYSIPAFVAGMLMLVYLAYGNYLAIFPMERLHGDGADQMGFVQYFLDYIWHATLPVICLSLFGLAPLAMYARTSMLEILGQDYIRTARAKGLPEWKVIFKHGLRNALIPIITLFASFLPSLLGGSVIIEFLFNIPGMGRLSYDSILNKDIPTVMALVYVNAIVVMLSILMTDLMYVFVDPRITFDRASR